MPVKIGEEGDSVTPIRPKDIDNLVKEIRDRLCLKSQDKLSKCYRSTPYGHGSSRDLGSAQKCSCLKSSSIYKRSIWKKGEVACSCRVGNCPESPHKLLEKLLLEQTLIQEAVRRLKSQMEQTVIAASAQQPMDEQSQLCSTDNSSQSTSSNLSSFSFGAVSPEVLFSDTS